MADAIQIDASMKRAAIPAAEAPAKRNRIERQSLNLSSDRGFLVTCQNKLTLRSGMKLF